MLSRSLCACALASLLIGALPEIAAAQQERNASKATAQPDKILYDRGVGDIQSKRFEVARVLLQSLINTYGSSEYLPKAYLALAESWFEEGGAQRLEKAREQCRVLNQQFPDSTEAKQALELLRKIDDLVKRPAAQ